MSKSALQHFLRPPSGWADFYVVRLDPVIGIILPTMPFTITKELEQVPSYPMLCKLAEQNDVQVKGDEHTGSFFFRGGEGGYVFGEGEMRGTFAGHGVTGEFSFEIGKAAVTITDKPFWLPEMLLKQKIEEGLDMLWKELAPKPR